MNDSPSQAAQHHSIQMQQHQSNNQSKVYYKHFAYDSTNLCPQTSQFNSSANNNNTYIDNNGNVLEIPQQQQQQQQQQQLFAIAQHPFATDYIHLPVTHPQQTWLPSTPASFHLQQAAKHPAAGSDNVREDVDDGDYVNTDETQPNVNVIHKQEALHLIHSSCQFKENCAQQLDQQTQLQPSSQRALSQTDLARSPYNLTGLETQHYVDNNVVKYDSENLASLSATNAFNVSNNSDNRDNSESVVYANCCPTGAIDSCEAAGYHNVNASCGAFYRDQSSSSSNDRLDEADNDGSTLTSLQLPKSEQSPPPSNSNPICHVGSSLSVSSTSCSSVDLSDISQEDFSVN